MTVEATALTTAIGQRVRDERLRVRWTLDQLASESGLSRRVVVNVEQGTTNPSISTLLRIGDALGIGLSTLVAPPATDTIRVVKNGEAPALWTSKNGGSAVLLAGTKSPDVAELWHWTLATHDHHESEAHSPGTTELLHVLAGTVVVSVGIDEFTLGVGDALRFPGDVAHSYSNPGGEASSFSLAVFEPMPRSTHVEHSHD
jgi:transcriptional regulator with XRE-family HTH domain